MIYAFFIYGLYAGRCQVTTSFDSYGRGIEAGYKDTETLPQIADPQCYALGKNVGVALKEQCEASNSNSDFDNGWQEGLVGSLNSAGSSCYQAGYTAGIALLDVCAREGCEQITDPSCSDEYARGKTDMQARQPSSPTLNQPDMHCYELGYYEGVVLF